MCYRVNTNFSIKQAEKYYDAKETDLDYQPEDEINCFSHPKTAVILDIAPTEILKAQWGLMPIWAKEDFLKKTNTLNAKIETAETLNSYKNSTKNRCLIPVKSFYEWQWQDAKGKNKRKFEIAIKDSTLFSLAGIYSLWENPETGKELYTYSIVTTKANELMSKIHNIKKRMPICLAQNNHKKWLEGNPLEDFSFPNLNPNLAAVEKSENLFAELFPL